jgi:hypothetical protein
VGCNTQGYGSNARNLFVELFLSQTSKNAMFFLLSLMFSLQQNQRTRGQNRFCLKRGGVAQIMYTQISKCTSDKIK